MLDQRCAALPPEIASSRDGATTTHDWGYTSEPGWPERSIPLLRGKLVGGSAAINNSVAIRGGTPRDYDGWCARGNEPSISPGACTSLGHVHVEDHNAPGATGVGPFPSTGLGGIRQSTASVYLHPARRRPNLTVRDGVTVDRIVCQRGRVTGLQVAGSSEVVESHQIILAAGAYGSQAILLRGGTGPLDQLRDLHISVVLDRRGVGFLAWCSRV